MPSSRFIRCCLAISCFTSTSGAQALASEAAPEIRAPAAKRLSISVVGDAALLATFQRRVSSWFSDGTEVQVIVVSAVEPDQLLTASPTEVRAWIVPISAERALLTFSLVNPPAPPRHLLREVKLRDGFDELGLERLASVAHSAFVALSEGSEGIAREQAERELGAAVIVRGPREAAKPPAPAPPRVPQEQPKIARPRPTPRDRERPPPLRQLFVAPGYGLRVRGAEGIGHGPSLALGMQWRSAHTLFDLQCSGQYLFRSEFDATPFTASVQTTALRVGLGAEPRLGASWHLLALVGLGVDLARISAKADTGSLARPRSKGTQWRGAGELTLGVWRRAADFDVGLSAHAILALQDVRYDAATSQGEVLLVRPWQLEPGLSLHGRFRSAL
jgi:hypothetical protein